MKNPYEILGLSPQATRQDIAKALVLAQRDNMKTKQYTPQELMQAHKQLLDPAIRLAADFLFPAPFKTKRLLTLSAENSTEPLVQLDSIHPDTLDSLR